MRACLNTHVMLVVNIEYMNTHCQLNYLSYTGSVYEKHKICYHSYKCSRLYRAVPYTFSMWPGKDACTRVSHACCMRAFVKLPLSHTVHLTCHFRRWIHVKARRTPSFGDCQTDGSQLGFIPTESDTMTCYCMTLCMLPSALASAGSPTLAHNIAYLKLEYRLTAI